MGDMARDLLLGDADRRCLRDELAHLYPDSPAATRLLVDIGLERSRQPLWESAGNPIGWWAGVFAEFDRGAVEIPYRRLLLTALAEYPSNGVLQEIARRHEVEARPVAVAAGPHPERETAPPGGRLGGGGHAAGAILVREASPRRLGVHPAIAVPGVSDDTPPGYVLRDVDLAEDGWRTRLAAAAERGGFVLLVGGSSVGKTRCAYEAVLTVLDDWWLIHPAGPAEVAALAKRPPARTVIWLDEIQRYLDGKDGLTGGVVRALLNAPTPVVIVGTLWPGRFATYTALPARGSNDPHAREREVLHLADAVRIEPDFSVSEQARARDAATGDRRLQVALAATGYGLTQTLAAAPALVVYWTDAKAADPYAWAVMTAALDIARLGAQAPLPPALLRQAAVDYCTGSQQATAPADWFDQALDYATRTLYGAAAALVPAASGMGQTAGYTVADYLLQHVTDARRMTRVPASVWNALREHITDAADSARLAYSAEARLLYSVAIPLYRQAVNAGDRSFANRLANRLAWRGDRDAAIQVLQNQADADDPQVAFQLARLLWNRDDRDEAVQVLRARVDAGDGWAAYELADLLEVHGDRDEARALRVQADAGDGLAAYRLLDGSGPEGTTQILRAHADAGDGWTANRLVDLFVDRGDLDELRALADVGDDYAANRLAGLLVDRGDLGEQVLRARAAAGDIFAAVELREQCGDLDEQLLQVRAVLGDDYAAYQLADLLVDRGDADGAEQVLRAQVDAGDWKARKRLVDLLSYVGRIEEGDRLRRFGLDPDGSIASG
jgi:hypothetical protein